MIRVYDSIVIIHTLLPLRRTDNLQVAISMIAKSWNQILIFMYKFKVAEYTVEDQGSILCGQLQETFNTFHDIIHIGRSMAKLQFIQVADEMLDVTKQKTLD